MEILPPDELAALREWLAKHHVAGYCERSAQDGWAVPINPQLACALSVSSDLFGYGPCRPHQDALALSARGLLN